MFGCREIDVVPLQVTDQRRVVIVRDARKVLRLVGRAVADDVLLLVDFRDPNLAALQSTVEVGIGLFRGVRCADARQALHHRQKHDDDDDEDQDVFR